MGFSGALKRAVDTALAQKQLGNASAFNNPFSPTSSLPGWISASTGNVEDSEERYALEVVKRAKNVEWTLVLATLARDKSTLLELIDLKTSGVMHDAWHHAVESCIEGDFFSSSNNEDERDGSSRKEEEENEASYKRAFFSQLLFDIAAEAKKYAAGGREKGKNALSVVIPDTPKLY